MRIFSQGFTLIELLVVIAIIGLLASIITIALQGSQDEAKLANVKSFYGQVLHVLAVDAVGRWSFEEMSSPSVDTSGYNNDATWQGAIESKNESDCGLGFGRCLDFNSGEYLNVPNNSFLNFGSIQDFTISVWVYPKSYTGQSANIFVFKGSSAGSTMGYLLGWNGTGKAVLFVRDCTASSGCGIQMPGNTTLVANRWHHIVGIADRDGNATLYVDGVKDVQMSLAGVDNIDVAGSTLKLGILSAGNWRFDGMMDEVSIYRRALSISEVQTLYAEGLQRLHVASEM